jgi:hypothetical protein
MHMEGILLATYVGCQSCFNRSDRCIYNRCEALRSYDAHLMGIKCTCEGGIHRFAMYLKRIRKRNTVEQHQVVSLRSQIVGV